MNNMTVECTIQNHFSHVKKKKTTKKYISWHMFTKPLSIVFFSFYKYFSIPSFINTFISRTSLNLTILLYGIYIYSTQKYRRTRRGKRNPSFLRLCAIWTAVATNTCVIHITTTLLVVFVEKKKPNMVQCTPRHTNRLDARRSYIIMPQYCVYRVYRLKG